MWFYLDLAICLAGLAWSMAVTFRARCFFSLQNVAWAATLMLFFIRPIFEPFRYRQPMSDPGYNLMLIVGLVGLFVASFLIPIDAVESCGLKPSFKPFPVVIAVGTIVYFLYAAGILYLSYLRAGSLIGIFQQPLVERSLSAENYLEGRSLTSLLMKVPEILFYFGVFKLWESGRRILAAAAYGTIVMMVVATSAVRFDIIILLLAALAFVGREIFGLNQEVRSASSKGRPGNPVPARSQAIDFPPSRGGKRRRRMTLKFTFRNVFLTYLLLLGTALSYNLVGNYIRGGSLRSMAVVEDMLTLKAFREQTLTDLSYYGETYDLYEAIHSGLPLEYGKGWYYYSLISLIPRRLWPAKPITATSVRATIILHGQITENEGVRTYTIFGDGYWQFGYLGAALAPALFLYLYYLLVQFLQKIEGSQLVALTLLFDLIPPLRADLPIPLIIFEASLVFVVFLLCKKTGRVEKPQRNLGTVPLGVAGPAVAAPR
jgi:hypothetical protein